MLEFINKEKSNYEVIEVNSPLEFDYFFHGTLVENNNYWDFYINPLAVDDPWTANKLRQIADKLDELNS